MRPGVGLGHLGTYPVKHFDLLEPADLKVGVRAPDHGDVADAKVLNGPVGHHVEIGWPPKPPKMGRTRLLPPPKPPALKAEVNRRREWQSLRFVQEQQPLDDRGARPPARPAPGPRDQLANGNGVGHQRVRNNIGVGQPGESMDRCSRAGRAAPRTSTARIRPASGRPRAVAGPWRRGRVGISTLPGDGVIGRQLGDRLCLLAGLESHGPSSFRPEQLAIGQCHAQEDLVADGDVIKLACRANWARLAR